MLRVSAVAVVIVDLSPSDVPAALAAGPHRAAFVVLSVTDAGRLAAVRAHDLHVAGVHRRLLRDDAADLRAPLGCRHLGVFLHPVDAFYQHATLRRQGQQHLATGAAVLAAAHHDGVALLHEQLRHRYSTSGANEMIFMNRFSRSSRPTGPKMRVPRGSPPSRISTAAFSSKRI